MAKIYIADLKKNRGEELNTLLAVKQINEASGRTGKKYLKLTVFDKSGEIDARAFESYESWLNFLEIGGIYSFLVRAESYNNQEYLKVSRISPVKDFEIEDFLPVSSHDYITVLAEVKELLGLIRNPHLRRLIDLVLSDTDLISKFERWPAAKEWHHAYLHGLLVHTASVMRHSRRIAEDYGLDSDLLLTGSFLHDIGKIEEYEFRGALIDFSTRGRLLGHIVIGSMMLEQMIAKIPDFPKELANALTHLIVSHHGNHEWGSPKLPKFKEAMVLFLSDYLDSQLAGIDKLYQQNQGRDWTDFNKFLERYIYIYKENREGN
ncbi:MAG: HD domain-containing protein [Candidatus Wallbacteria bacterium]|nr:HD domain-containing protein [Candidatus Wallbacteria bacterium]